MVPQWRHFMCFSRRVVKIQKFKIPLIKNNSLFKWFYKNIKLDIVLTILGPFLQIINIVRLMIMTKMFKPPCLL